MPKKNKTPISINIESNQLSWLQDITKQYELNDISKATRILLDYAILEANTEEIFSSKNIRCNNCG
ncbi:MAG: hypothetical protein FI687_02000 [SAR202 cluster bacterium]|nr:hypothetical protein [SAR202 cluster bacterium]